MLTKRKLPPASAKTVERMNIDLAEIIRIVLYTLLAAAGFMIFIKLLKFIAGIIAGIVLTGVLAYLYYTKFM